MLDQPQKNDGVDVPGLKDLPPAMNNLAKAIKDAEQNLPAAIQQQTGIMELEAKTVATETTLHVVPWSFCFGILAGYLLFGLRKK